MEDARLIHPALIHLEMQMRMKIDAVSERLDDRNDPRLERPPRRGLKIQEKRPDGTAAELTQELALKLEENPQHLGNDEDHLTVRNVQEERLPHPLPPFLQPLGMTGGIEAAATLTRMTIEESASGGFSFRSSRPRVLDI